MEFEIINELDTIKRVIPEVYDLALSEAEAIQKNNMHGKMIDGFGAIYDAFLFGFAKGLKAQKELKLL